MILIAKTIARVEGFPFPVQPGYSLFVIVSEIPESNQCALARETTLQNKHSRGDNQDGRPKRQ